MDDNLVPVRRHALVLRSARRRLDRRAPILSIANAWRCCGAVWCRRPTCALGSADGRNSRTFRRRPGPQPRARRARTRERAEDDPNSPQCTIQRRHQDSDGRVCAADRPLVHRLSRGDGPFGPPTIHPGPWLFGGLIPMFVGIAQIIIALALRRDVRSRAHAAAARRHRRRGRAAGTFYARPSPAPPGPRYEELARPVPPPDRQ